MRFSAKIVFNSIEKPVNRVSFSSRVIPDSKKPAVSNKVVFKSFVVWQNMK